MVILLWQTANICFSQNYELNRNLYGHDSLVMSVSFSPDGKYIASGSWDHTIRIWELSSGKCIQTLAGHKDKIWSVSFSPGGKYLASGSLDKTVKIWDINSGNCVSTLTVNDEVASVCFSPDGRYLVSGSDRGYIDLWYFGEEGRGIMGRFVKTFNNEHSEPVLSLSFSPDGKLLASGSMDKTIKIWEFSSGKCIQTLAGHKDEIWSVSFSPGGKYLASGSKDGTVKIWEVNTWQCIRTFEGNTGMMYSVDFSPDGKYLISGSQNNTIYIWEINKGKYVRTLDAGGYNNVLSVQFSPDGEYIAAGLSDRGVVILKKVDEYTRYTFNFSFGVDVGVRMLGFEYEVLLNDYWYSLNPTNADKRIYPIFDYSANYDLALHLLRKFELGYFHRISGGLGTRFSENNFVHILNLKSVQDGLSIKYLLWFGEYYSDALFFQFLYGRNRLKGFYREQFDNIGDDEVYYNRQLTGEAPFWSIGIGLASYEDHGYANIGLFLNYSMINQVKYFITKDNFNPANIGNSGIEPKLKLNYFSFLMGIKFGFYF